MRGVTLDGLDEVRDQVVAPLELDIDVGPRLLHALTQRDEAVVRADEEQRERGDDDGNDDDLHEALPRLRCEATRRLASARLRIQAER